MQYEPGDFVFIRISPKDRHRWWRVWRTNGQLVDLRPIVFGERLFLWRLRARRMVATIGRGLQRWWRSM